MRRRWLAVLILFTALVVALFFSHVLTGRTIADKQNPYSRLSRRIETRFGFHFDVTEPNVMSDYYYSTLRQPQEDRWEPASNTIRRPPFSFSDVEVVHSIPPIIYLDTNVEVEFLKALPSDKVRLAVIRALYQPRDPHSTPAAKAKREQLEQVEQKRVRRIVTWYEIERHDRSISFSQWWRDNAATFGLHEDGLPRSAPTAVPVSPISKR